MFTKWILFCFIDLIESKMEPFIVGGDYTDIYNFPHSAFLSINCVTKHKDEGGYWICGGSILNQEIVMTAAHCVAACVFGSYMTATVGNENKNMGEILSIRSYVIHEDYVPTKTSADIALARLKHSFQLNSEVRRVALMENPPYNEVAHLAGWGLVDEKHTFTSNRLKSIEQSIWSQNECKMRIMTMPDGCFCASSKDIHDYAARGDSGSALIVRGYIQVGLVSYKVPSVAKNLIVYTDVGYYYNWIQDRAKLLYCS